MNFFDLILLPFKWIVSAVLWVFHELFTLIGADPTSGLTWVLCIVGLTLVMRTLTIPLFLKQIKSMRGMQELQPEMAKLQAKYKGKKDQLSRQAMAEEQMALYKKHGSNPFAACLPVIVQMPIFFALFQVLRSVPQAAANNEAIHLLTPEMVHQFNESTIFGAPLFSTLMQPGDGNHTATIVLAIVMIVAMSATQFITQKQLTARNMSDTAKASPMYRQQQMMLYLFPIIFAVGGINFPWACSSTGPSPTCGPWASSGGSSATTPPRDPRRSASSTSGAPPRACPRGHDQEGARGEGRGAAGACGCRPAQPARVQEASEAADQEEQRLRGLPP